ncbi:MAG: flavodoxin domain-containing protein [Mangrovibacterium sp.]
MKTLILFMSTHGCALKIAHQIAGQLSGEVQLHNLNISSNVNLSLYNRVIIGGSIHVGKIQSRVKVFCQDHLNELLQKEIGLYICCMEEGEVARKELKQAFPEELHTHAKAEAIMGGEFIFEKMNVFERFLVKKIAKVNQTVHKIDWNVVNDFSRSMEGSRLNA